MLKYFLTLLLSYFILSCGIGKNKDLKEGKISDEEKAFTIYQEAIKALDEGDAFYAGEQFKKVENLLPQSKWAAKASLMSAYANYSRNSYSNAVFDLERHIRNYPADKNIPYAHYLIAMCFYEQILDEKKDLQPLLKAKNQFNFVIANYPNSDFALDAKFKLDLIKEVLASKEMYLGSYYIQKEKWIAAINRYKTVINDYETTIYVEEALHRLVELHYKIGLENEAKKYANLLGYNYLSSDWYKSSYKVFNKDYKLPKQKERKKESNFIIKKYNSIFIKKDE